MRSLGPEGTDRWAKAGRGWYSRTMRRVPLLALTVLIAACGGTRDRPLGTNNASSNNNNRTNNNNVGPTVIPDHPAICNQACASPAQGPCGADQAPACTSACAAKTNGLSSACAACITGESAYAGLACTCYGEGCTLCGFGAGDQACSGALPTDTCEAGDEVCEGYEVADIVDGPCESVCLDDENNPPNLGPTLRDRCNRLCDNRPRACEGASASECLSTCLTQAMATEGACALCRIEASAWAGRACSCYGEGCGLCSFGPEDSPCVGPSPQQTCQADQEVCDGLEFAPLTEACARLCT